MIETLAIANYRSLRQLTLPLGRLNVITGANGSGKSNLYRALRLLAQTARGGVIGALAHEGGLSSTVWAGPDRITPQMRDGTAPIQGGPRKGPVRLRLGFAGSDFGYSISLGLPQAPPSAFSLDPEIKRECIWAGPHFRTASLLVDRKGHMVRVRSGRSWDTAPEQIAGFDSLLSHASGTSWTPEAVHMRETILSWRFYDHFRTDADAPARVPQLGTRTPVLHHDGHDLAAAVQTIREIGDAEALDEAISDAFPGATLDIATHEDTRFSLEFRQSGLLRCLTGAELSDGTLRYLLWVAALLTPRPPALMVLNEPETSLSPDLLPALARLIVTASEQTQIWIVSHAPPLIDALTRHSACRSIRLEKSLSETRIVDQALLDEPVWHWPD